MAFVGARFVADEAAFLALLSGTDGLVARDLIRRAVNVETQAKINASGRPGPNVQSGRLRSSITPEIDRDSAGLYANIGSNVVYARIIELGDPDLDRKAYPYLVPAMQAAAQ